MEHIISVEHVLEVACRLLVLVQVLQDQLEAHLVELNRLKLKSCLYEFVAGSWQLLHQILFLGRLLLRAEVGATFSEQAVFFLHLAKVGESDFSVEVPVLVLFLLVDHQILQLLERPNIIMKEDLCRLTGREDVQLELDLDEHRVRV